MSLPKKQATALHRLLMERFPKAFPQDYDAILPLKLDIDVDIRERLIQQGAPVDPDLLRRVLANHVGRAGYLLALIHRRDGRRFDLDGKPAGEVDALARSEAVRLLGEHQKRQKEASTRHRHHQALRSNSGAPRPNGLPSVSGEPPKSNAGARSTSATVSGASNGGPPRHGRARRARPPGAGKNRPCRRSFTRNGGGSIREAVIREAGRNSRRSEDRRARISACGGGS